MSTCSCCSGYYTDESCSTCCDDYRYRKPSRGYVINRGGKGRWTAPQVHAPDHWGNPPDPALAYAGGGGGYSWDVQGAAHHHITAESSPHPQQAHPIPTNLAYLAAERQRREEALARWQDTVTRAYILQEEDSRMHRTHSEKEKQLEARIAELESKLAQESKPPAKSQTTATHPPQPSDPFLETLQRLMMQESMEDVLKFISSDEKYMKARAQKIEAVKQFQAKNALQGQQPQQQQQQQQQQQRQEPKQQPHQQQQPEQRERMNQIADMVRTKGMLRDMRKQFQVKRS